MSSKEILEQLDFILLLMTKEYAGKMTHSERNAYQQVMRVEIQNLKLQLLYHPFDRTETDPNVIPW